LSNFSKKKTNLLLVDISSIAFRYYKNPDSMVEGLASMIYSFAGSYGAKDIVACCDYGKSSYRMSEYAEYKSNRADKKKERTPEEQESIDHYYNCQKLAIETLPSQGIKVLQQYGVEADDLIGYMVNNYSDNYEHTWILSADKDFMSLLSERVSQFSTTQSKTFDLEYLKRELDCDPPTFLRALILSGDKIDGIPGYYLVGEPKKPTSRSLVYARMGESYSSICEQIKKKPKIGKIDQFILDNPDIYERNIKLIELHSEVLTDKQKDYIVETISGS